MRKSMHSNLMAYALRDQHSSILQTLDDTSWQEFHPRLKHRIDTSPLPIPSALFECFTFKQISLRSHNSAMHLQIIIVMKNVVTLRKLSSSFDREVVGMTTPQSCCIKWCPLSFCQSSGCKRCRSSHVFAPPLNIKGKCTC